MPGDFNGDGTTDLLFYAAGAAPDSLWIAHHDGTFTSESLTINGMYQVVAGDFNGDGATDLFFYVPGVAPDYLWNGVTGGTFHPDPSPFAINNRYVITAADMNGDGRSDLVLYAAGYCARLPTGWARPRHVHVLAPHDQRLLRHRARR